MVSEYRSYCVYRMHGVEFFRGTIFYDLVRFRFAVVVIFLARDDHLYIMSLVCSYVCLAGSTY